MKYVTALLALVIILSLALPARTDAQLFESFDDVAEIHTDSEVVIQRARKEELAYVEVLAKKDILRANLKITEVSSGLQARIYKGDCNDIPAGGFESLSYFVGTDEVKGTFNIELTVTVISAESGKKYSNSKRTFVKATEHDYCFIATACYGSPLAEEINVLRDFRDVVMLEDDFGRTLVDFYYVASPPVADIIAQNEALRYIARYGLIEPLVFMIKVIRPVWDG